MPKVSPSEISPGLACFLRGCALRGHIKDRLYVHDYGAVMGTVGHTDAYDVHPLAMLPMHMDGWLMRGIPLITHNGEGFDLPILAKPMVDGGAGCAKAVSRYAERGLHIDTCARLLAHWPAYPPV